MEMTLLITITCMSILSGVAAIAVLVDMYSNRKKKTEQ